MKKTGLGRGLDALMGESFSVETGIGQEYIHQLPVSLIDVNKGQPRKSFDDASIRALADSIAANGLLQPITVCQKGSRYEIVAGERRYRACRLLEMQEVPAIVKELSPRQVCELALIENLQREDLNPLEEAAAMQALMDEFRLTQLEISQRLGISRPAIANAVRLLKLPEKVRALVADGALSAGHARALAAVADEKRMLLLAQSAVQEGWSVRETERRVQAEGNKRAPKPPKKERAVEFAEAEDRMRRHLGTRVSIAGNEKKGQIRIEYFSRDDLERVIALLGGEE